MPEYKQLERPYYFYGKLLTADDLALEQDYGRDRSRRIPPQRSDRNWRSDHTQRGAPAQ